MSAKEMRPSEAGQLPNGRQNQTKHHHQEEYSTKLSRVLPREMIGLPQFVCHRAKVPYDPKTGKKADVTNSATWGTFAQAQLRYLQGGWDGIGFVFTEAAGIVGTDLDKCRDPKTGKIAPWANYMIFQLAGYVEVSPSGTGVHILLLGTLPENGRRRGTTDGGGVEMYKAGRFFTLTGDVLPVASTGLEVSQDALNAIYADLFPAKPAKAETPARDYTPLSMDDTELLTRARNNPDAAKAARFIALYDRGDTAGYKSASEADAALCNDLAYYCGPTADDRVADLFRRSALYREKADRDDYLTATIALAYDGRTAFFTPKIASNPTPGNQFDFTPPAADGDTSDELATLRAENARLKAENETLRRQDSTSLTDFRFWIDDLLAIPERRMSASEKMVAIAMRRKAERTHHDIRRADDSWKVCQMEIADKTGFSPSTVSKAWQRWGKADAGPYQLEQKEEPVKVIDPVTKAERIEMHTMTFAKLQPAIIQPKTWMPPDGERQRGGKRENAGRKPKCEDCGAEDSQSEQVMIETAERKVLETRCKKCGTVHYERLGPDKVIGRRPDGNQFDFVPETSADVPDAPATCPPSVEASIGQQIENSRAEINLISPPPQRPCIRCRAYDWRCDGDRWYCGSCSPVEMAVS